RRDAEGVLPCLERTGIPFGWTRNIGVPPGPVKESERCRKTLSTENVRFQVDAQESGHWPASRSGRGAALVGRPFSIETERRAHARVRHRQRRGAEPGAEEKVFRERPVVRDEGTFAAELRHGGVRRANETRNELRPLLLRQRGRVGGAVEIFDDAGSREDYLDRRWAEIDRLPASEKKNAASAGPAFAAPERDRDPR